MFQAPHIFWVMGRPASGKTTFALNLKNYIEEDCCLPVIHLDGDMLRVGLCTDLQYSRKARLENHRRAAEVAKILYNQGYIVICSFITPTKHERHLISEIFEELDWSLIYIKCPVTICSSPERDIKGNYKKAFAGRLKGFTGVSPSALFEDAGKVASIVLNSGLWDAKTLFNIFIDWVEG